MHTEKGPRAFLLNGGAVGSLKPSHRAFDAQSSIQISGMSNEISGLLPKHVSSLHDPCSLKSNTSSWDVSGSPESSRRTQHRHCAGERRMLERLSVVPVDTFDWDASTGGGLFFSLSRCRAGQRHRVLEPAETAGPWKVHRTSHASGRTADALSMLHT